MNHAEFVEKYLAIAEKALTGSVKARREGLLALDEDLEMEMIDERDIFEYGLRFVIDGTDPEIIDTILSNLVKQEKDEQLRLLKEIQKAAVLGIQNGTSPRILYALLNSFTALSLNDQPFPDFAAEKY
jgi:flagellar motor component MotA